jgi:N-acetylmuramoyl-L-alanine amidase
MDSATDVPVILTEEYASGCAAAIVEVIVRKAGLSRKQTDTANLPDAWAAQAWYNATAQGVLDGTRPRDPLTRQEFAVVLSKLGLLGKN